MRLNDRCLRGGWAALLAALLMPLAVCAAEGASRATTSRAAREEAIRSIPYKQLSPDGQAKVGEVLANVSMYRRMPTQVTRCDPALYLFMINHPDVTVNLWQVLDVTTIQLQQVGGATFRANDGQGTKGDVEFLYRTNDTHLLYASGTYEGPLFQNPVHGTCLLLLKSAFQRDAEGNDFVTSQLDVFFSLDHVGLDLLTKTFHPLVGKSADYNFVESATFLGTLHRTCELKPSAMQQLAAKLNKIDPRHRDEFASVMAAIPEKMAQRQATTMTTAQPVAAPRPTVRNIPNLRR